MVVAVNVVSTLVLCVVAFIVVNVYEENICGKIIFCYVELYGTRNLIGQPDGPYATSMYDQHDT